MAEEESFGAMPARIKALEAEVKSLREAVGALIVSTVLWQHGAPLMNRYSALGIPGQIGQLTPGGIPTKAVPVFKRFIEEIQKLDG